MRPAYQAAPVPKEPGRNRRMRANLAGAIYGTITAAAVIAATHEKSPVGATLSVTVSTLVVFWMAHVYAEVVGHHMTDRRLTFGAVRAEAARQLPILEAPAPAVVVLAGGAFGRLDPELAGDLALWTAAVQLIGWGTAFGRQQGWPWPAALLIGALNGVLGAAIVVLKALVH